MSKSTADINRPQDLVRIRKWLALSQEAMARLLCASFVSVSRWELGKTEAAGLHLEVYRALAEAKRQGRKPDINGSSGAVLRNIFQAGYGR